MKTTVVQLCIGLNNMYHVKKALAAMPTSMELDKYYEWLDKEEGIGKKVNHITVIIECPISFGRLLG